MALSANAAKTLEQVKMGVLKLYGADYFTEAEFIKIDGLIHKGKYVFTSGPPKHAYDEELMTFEESPDEMKPINVQTNSIHSFEPSKKEAIVASEEQIPSPSLSEGTDSHFRMDGTPNATSAEASSDEETAPPTTSSAEIAPMFDFSESNAASSIKPPEPKPQPETSNGLPPGITQKQLDEARAMQAEMTKAGKKGRPKYDRQADPISDSARAEDFPSEPTTVEEACPSPAPSERDTRISTWASEVNAQQSSSPQIASPTPTKQPVDPAVLFEQFVKVQGRQPKNLNDFYQPNNPGHYSNKPGSVASNTTNKTSKTAKTTRTTNVAPKNGLKLGSTYVAQNSQFKSSHILVDIKAGDYIRVNKFVSGIQWLGTNLRTNSSGQFSEEIFKAPITRKKSVPQKPVETASTAPSVTSSAIHNGLENVEGVNAAEWDDVPVSSRHKPAPPATARPALGGGLASSRFSVLADREEPKPQTPQGPSNQQITAAMKMEFGKMVDEKVDEILKARGMAPTPAPAALPTGLSRSRTLKPIPPKQNTCWFWATGKGCRFTAEECRDLHGHLPTATGEPTNLHLGKPTWGALADSSQTLGHANPDSFTEPEVAADSSDSRARAMTCWYWARDGKCNYTAETCKYLHAHTTKGVAPRPWQKFPSWGTHTWKRKEDGDETVDGEGTVGGWGEGEVENGDELVLEEVNGDDSVSIAGWGVIGDGGAGGWGRDTPVPDGTSGWGGDDKYKPPHIKALEEKAKVEAVGW